MTLIRKSTDVNYSSPKLESDQLLSNKIALIFDATLWGPSPGGGTAQLPHVRSVGNNVYYAVGGIVNISGGVLNPGQTIATWPEEAIAILENDGAFRIFGSFNPPAMASNPISLTVDKNDGITLNATLQDAEELYFNFVYVANGNQ